MLTDDIWNACTCPLKIGARCANGEHHFRECPLWELEETARARGVSVLHPENAGEVLKEWQETTDHGGNPL